MKRMKLVMVGNGMAGVRTLEELLKGGDGVSRAGEAAPGTPQERG